MFLGELLADIQLVAPVTNEVFFVANAVCDVCEAVTAANAMAVVVASEGADMDER